MWKIDKKCPVLVSIFSEAEVCSLIDLIIYSVRFIYFEIWHGNIDLSKTSQLNRTKYDNITTTQQLLHCYLAGIYLLKINNRNTRTRSKIWSKLKKTPRLTLHLTMVLFRLSRTTLKTATSLQTHSVYYTLKRRGNHRFHVVSTWDTRGVFVGFQ